MSITYVAKKKPGVYLALEVGDLTSRQLEIVILTLTKTKFTTPDHVNIILTR